MKSTILILGIVIFIVIITIVITIRIVCRKPVNKPLEDNIGKLPDKVAERKNAESKPHDEREERKLVKEGLLTKEEFQHCMENDICPAKLASEKISKRIDKMVKEHKGISKLVADFKDIENVKNEKKD